MSDSERPAWRSNALPLSVQELREYEQRFADFEHDYDFFSGSRDVQWPEEPSGDA